MKILKCTFHSHFIRFFCICFFILLSIHFQSYATVKSEFHEQSPCIEESSDVPKQVHTSTNEVDDLMMLFGLQIFQPPSQKDSTIKKSLPFMPPGLNPQLIHIWEKNHEISSQESPSKEKLQRQFKLTLDSQNTILPLRKGKIRGPTKIRALSQKLLPLLKSAQLKDWKLLYGFLKNDAKLRRSLAPDIQNVIEQSFQKIIVPEIKEFLIDPSWLEDSKSTSWSPEEQDKRKDQKDKIIKEIFDSEIIFWEGINALGQLDSNQMGEKGKKIVHLAKELSEVSFQFIKRLRVIINNHLQHHQLSNKVSSSINRELQNIYFSDLWKRYASLIFKYVLLYDDFLVEYQASHTSPGSKKTLNDEMAKIRFMTFDKTPSLRKRFVDKFLEGKGSHDIQSEQDPQFEEGFKLFIKKTNVLTNAITPVQRLPRHQLLLGSLRENSHQSEDGYSELKSTYDNLVNSIQAVNELKRAYDLFK